MSACYAVKNIAVLERLGAVLSLMWLTITTHLMPISIIAIAK